MNPHASGGLRRRDATETCARRSRSRPGWALGLVLAGIATALVGVLAVYLVGPLVGTILILSGFVLLQGGISWALTMRVLDRQQRADRDMQEYIQNAPPGSLTGVPDCKVPGKKMPMSWPSAVAASIFMGALAAGFSWVEDHHWAFTAGLGSVVVLLMLFLNGRARLQVRELRAQRRRAKA